MSAGFDMCSSFRPGIDGDFHLRGSDFTHDRRSNEAALKYMLSERFRQGYLL